MILWPVYPRTVCFFGEIIFHLSGRRRKERELNLLDCKRILVVRLDAVGDFVLSTSFLRELRGNYPEAFISLVVQSAVYDLAKSCPYVDEVLIFPPYKKLLRRHLGLIYVFVRNLLFARKYLLKKKFDLAINVCWDVDFSGASYMAYLSGAPWRLGYSEKVYPRKQRLNPGFDRFYSHVLNNSSIKHEVQLNLDLIRFLGGKVRRDHLELWLNEEEKRFARKIYVDNRLLSENLLIGLGLTGGKTKLKQWSLDNYIRLINKVVNKKQIAAMLLGKKNEFDSADQFEKNVKAPVINMAGRTTLSQAASLIELSDLYIGNDDALAHIAVAVGTPAVVIFGPSCPHRYAPWGGQKAVVWLGLPCSQCFKREHWHRCLSCIYDRPKCLESVKIDQVEREIERILGGLEKNG